ncbi:MAG: TetR/AcrR family transcriptional regulator [Clostridia bacterium]|nr:TetR/AcrR family transcriptional regulator [Clostridia bacterium]
MSRSVEYDAKRKDATQKKIIETAYRLFCENTIDATTYQKIANTSGLGIATLFRYFPTKTDLVAQVSVWAWKRYLDRESPIDWQKGTAAEILELFLNEFIVLYRDSRDLLRFNQFFNVYVQREGVLPDVMKPYHNVIDTVASKFHRLYEKAEADGTVRTDIPENVMFSTILHLMLAAVTRYAVGLVYDGGSDPEQELMLLKDVLYSRFTIRQEGT